MSTYTRVNEPKVEMQKPSLDEMLLMGKLESMTESALVDYLKSIPRPRPGEGYYNDADVYAFSALFRCLKKRNVLLPESVLLELLEQLKSRVGYEGARLLEELLSNQIAFPLFPEGSMLKIIELLKNEDDGEVDRTRREREQYARVQDAAVRIISEMPFLSANVFLQFIEISENKDISWNVTKPIKELLGKQTWTNALKAYKETKNEKILFFLVENSLIKRWPVYFYEDILCVGEHEKINLRMEPVEFKQTVLEFISQYANHFLFDNQPSVALVPLSAPGKPGLFSPKPNVLSEFNEKSRSILLDEAKELLETVTTAHLSRYEHDPIIMASCKNLQALVLKQTTGQGLSKEEQQLIFTLLDKARALKDKIDAEYDTQRCVLS